jgi:hypothetical protein
MQNQMLLATITMLRKENITTNVWSLGIGFEQFNWNCDVIRDLSVLISKTGNIKFGW